MGMIIDFGYLKMIVDTLQDARGQLMVNSWFGAGVVWIPGIPL